METVGEYHILHDFAWLSIQLFDFDSFEDENWTDNSLNQRVRQLERDNVQRLTFKVNDSHYYLCTVNLKRHVQLDYTYDSVTSITFFLLPCLTGKERTMSLGPPSF